MLDAIYDRLAELLKGSGQDVESLSLRVVHNVEKPDFIGDLYTATIETSEGVKKEAQWTVGQLFIDDNMAVEPTARNLADRLLEDYAAEE